MAKINILFDGTDYSIDEANLEPATAELKTHLLSAMNGTGTTLKLDGTSYSVDSTKLSSARDSFIAHLGAISGNGLKIRINGVEYSVDINKVSDSITDLKTVLSNLSNSTPDSGGIKLLSLDDFILKDSNGVYLTVKEEN